MVVLSVAVCTKSGKPIIARQFREMPRTRVESLLNSFPKLLPPTASVQHTTIETSSVRYVYQPLDSLYIVLITNKASNILQDIDTLHLVARVIADICRTQDEPEIQKHAFELLGAFDEIVSLGFREQVGLVQIRSVLEMESHEEKIQEIIARNKEAEAKEELKRRAKQLEMQRREQQRRAQNNPSFGENIGGYGSSANTGGYQSVSRYEAPVTRAESPAPAKPKAPAFKGTGMKLGSKVGTSRKGLLDALGGEAEFTPEPSRTTTPVAGSTSAAVSSQPPLSTRPSTIPKVEQDSVHAEIREHLSLTLNRDGSLQSIELKGDLNLTITDASLARVRIQLAPSPASASDLQFKQHPNVGRFNAALDRVVALKDPSKPFPVQKPLGVLRWRLVGKGDDSLIPLSINCWPTPSNDGTCDVNIEYELENDALTIYDLLINIPLPSGSYPTVSTSSGSWALNSATHSIDWTIPLVSGEDDTRSGALEFSVGGDDVSSFFPVRAAFGATGSVAGVAIDNIVLLEGETKTNFSQDIVVQVDEYSVV